jgi:hypothetical protein
MARAAEAVITMVTHSLTSVWLGLLYGLVQAQAQAQAGCFLNQVGQNLSHSALRGSSARAEPLLIAANPHASSFPVNERYSN